MVKKISIFIGIILGLIVYFLVNLIIMSVIIVFLGSWISYYFLSHLYDKDAIYIRSSLKSARKKTFEISTYGRRLPLWRLWIKIRYIRRINKEIIVNIQKHPNRFPKAEKFFSLYLDATLNILEKHTILVSQPIRSAGVKESLRTSEQMLEEVTKGLEQQLALVLEDDIMDLEIEKEVITKHASK